jgi:hypothetical protein
MASQRIALHLPVQPWFRDHRFDGRVIFPAVEAMCLLALTAQAADPALDVSRMQQGRFIKFLEIPPEATGLDVLVELASGESGSRCARLLTKMQRTTMVRSVTHCEVTFVVAASSTSRDAAPPRPLPNSPEMKLSAEQVYRYLVPFGPAYRTLQGSLLLANETAWGSLMAPDLPLAAPDLVGSPFPLDGAMHAACVHGQRLVDFVPFPVGFAARTLHLPTRAGEHYRTQVHLQSQTEDELVYDLQIIDRTEQLRETMTGLRMRDVSGGRIKPPPWLQSGLFPENQGLEETFFS